MAIFDVRAKENSITGGGALVTGISVHPGQLLSITSQGTWSAGKGDRISDANGLGNPLGGNFGTLREGNFEFLFGSLVGSLDGGQTFIGIGKKLLMTILAPGQLSLYYWDANHEDNVGFVRVTVNVYPIGGLLPVIDLWRLFRRSRQ